MIFMCGPGMLCEPREWPRTPKQQARHDRILREVFASPPPPPPQPPTTDLPVRVKIREALPK